MSGQRHLIECHCVLPIYKNKKPVVYHKFAVYSFFDEKTSKVIPKYVNCNNCGVTHLIEEFCKSKIKLGLNNYKGLDNQIYKVYIPFKQVRYNRISNVFTKKKMIIARMKGHKKLIYKKKQDHYSDLWKNNKIYKT